MTGDRAKFGSKDETEDRTGERGERAGAACGVCPVAALLGTGSTLGDRVTDMFPPEFVEHSVGARREFLLAIRSLVDHALKSQEEHLENYHRGQSARAGRKRGPQKVTVE